MIISHFFQQPMELKLYFGDDVLSLNCMFISNQANAGGCSLEPWHLYFFIVFSTFPEGELHWLRQ